MTDRIGDLAAQDSYDPFAAEQFVNPVVQSTMGALLAPRVRDANSPIAYRTASPLVNISEQDIADATDKAMAFSGGGLGIKVYHGSPYDFDRFDLSKIGTGEGAQAYGHGLYFAEGENVAKKYRDQLARPTIEGKAFNDADPLHVAASYIADHKTPEKALAALEKDLQWGEANKQFAPPQQTFDAMWDAKRLLRNGEPLPSLGPEKGYMYEVNINADPAHFLDWDKPAHLQSPEVISAISNILGKDAAKVPVSPFNGRPLTGPWRGGGVVDDIGYQSGMMGAASQRYASNALADQGLPGIKYFDAGSRGAGQGSSNYVVFNDKLIDILRKYGIAGLPAGAAGMGALAQQDNYQP